MVPTPVVRGTTFGDDRGYVTNGDRHDHRVVLLGQQAQLLDVLLGDAQLRGLIAARRLDPLGRLANALGRGALDDRDGGGRPHSPVDTTVAWCHCRGGGLSVAGPGGLVESGPELHTELSPPSAGVQRNPWQQGRHPKSVSLAPNATPVSRRRETPCARMCEQCAGRCGTSSLLRVHKVLWLLQRDHLGRARAGDHRQAASAAP